MFGMATRVVSMSTLVFLFPLLKKRYGDGVCLMLAVFGRGAGGFIVGLASLGGNCPHCDFFLFREFLLVLGATELLAGACESTVQVQQLPLRWHFQSKAAADSPLGAAAGDCLASGVRSTAGRGDVGAVRRRHFLPCRLLVADQDDVRAPSATSRGADGLAC